MGSSQKFLIFLLSWVKFLRQWGLYFPYCTAGKGLFFPFVKNCSYINSVCKKELRHLLHSLKVEQTRYGRILSKTIQNKKWNHGGQTTGWRKMVWMTHTDLWMISSALFILHASPGSNKIQSTTSIKAQQQHQGTGGA